MAKITHYKGIAPGILFPPQSLPTCVKVFERTYTFTEDSLYETKDPSNQDDWNKLGGIAYSLLAQDYSAMIGWRVNKKLRIVEVMLYCHDMSWRTPQNPKGWRTFGRLAKIDLRNSDFEVIGGVNTHLPIPQQLYDDITPTIKIVPSPEGRRYLMSVQRVEKASGQKYPLIEVVSDVISHNYEWGRFINPWFGGTETPNKKVQILVK
jgi:hypothetical protein